MIRIMHSHYRQERERMNLEADRSPISGAGLEFICYEWNTL